MKLFLDFETRSVLDLEQRGLDNYLHDSSTRVLMCGYAFNNLAVQLWQPHLAPELPRDFREALDDPFVIKVAWNSRFEKHVLQVLLGIDVPYCEFLDPMVWARHLSMPGSLGEVGKILGLTEDEAKLLEGKRLKKLFTEPASLGGEETLFGISEPTFHDWNTRPQDWELFCGYCRRDIEAERTILKKMEKFPLPLLEQQGWVLDQIINDRGLPVNMKLVSGASSVAETTKSFLKSQLKTLTDLENPNSNSQMLAYLKTQGYPFSSLAKGFVERALRDE